MADQFRFDALGSTGSSAVHTPRLDELSSHGTVFENCYCNSPLCVPSRASMLTGRLPFRIASYDNGSELPAGTPTLTHYLRLAGWQTVLSGKMHFIGPDQLHGFEERLVGDIYPAALDWTPDWRRGLYRNPGTSVRKLRLSGPAGPTAEMRYDDRVQAAALACLPRLARNQRPFFLCVSYTHPHDPFRIAEPYWNLYRDGEIDPPAAPSPLPEELHEYNRWIAFHQEQDLCPPSEEESRRSRRAYYGMVSYVDEKVGQLLARLEELGLANDTAVVFTSDHGEMLGDHGMWFKRTFYDGAAKVPLVIALPGAPPARRVQQVTSLVDLFPTILDIAGVAAPDDALDGHSLVPLLRDDCRDWKDQALGEYLGEGVLQPMRFVRQGRYKYVYVEEHPPLLFDLLSDPVEEVDLSGRPELACDEQDLRQVLLKDWDGPTIRRSVLRSQQERLLVSRALLTGRLRSWDYESRPEL